MTLDISREQARRLLTLYHFTPADLPGVFARLGTVQYDPLNPVGRNSDLVLQARVPGYQVDDWQKAAYTDRLIYDAWDKMACLVPLSDWPMRALIRERHRPYHDRQILESDPGAVAAVLAEIDARGPLSSLEFEDRSRYGEQGSWSGTSRVKRILRSLWACGQLLTHHRTGGRHYYDRPERVVPAHYFNAPPLLDEAAYYRWIMLRRHQATGLLRTTAEAAIWSACGDARVRARAVAQLLEMGELTPVRVGEEALPYHMLTSTLKLLDAPSPAPRMILLGPLDSLLWDRKTLRQLFNFDYSWEVYKPEAARKWGYYVLPVFYGDRFVARLDSRLEKGVWTIARWWWEPDITPDTELLDALRTAVEGFLRYLHADSVCVGESVSELVHQAIIGI